MIRTMGWRTTFRQTAPTRPTGPSWRRCLTGRQTQPAASPMAIHSARRGRGIRSMALYLTWSTSKAAGAPVHCTGDDIMIASLVLLGAFLIVGDQRRLQPRFQAVAAVAILGGPAYKIG